MKLLELTTALLLATITASPYALAYDASDSWDTINKAGIFAIEQPYSGFGPKGMFNMCATKDAFISLTPVPVCVEFNAPVSHGDYYELSDCSKSEARIVSMPRHGVAPVCVEWKSGVGETDNGPECLRYVDQAYELPATVEVGVAFKKGALFMTTAFRKSYTIPDCK